MREGASWARWGWSHAQAHWGMSAGRPAVQRSSAESRVPEGLRNLLGLPPAPLRDAATVVSHPASAACHSAPISSPVRWLQGPGGCCALRGLILALASRTGSAPSAPPLYRGPEPGGAIELSARRGRLGGAPGGEWSRVLRCTLFPMGWARGCGAPSFTAHTQRSSRAGLRAQPGKLGARRGRTAAVARVEGTPRTPARPGCPVGLRAGL